MGALLRDNQNKNDGPRRGYEREGAGNSSWIAKQGRFSQFKHRGMPPAHTEGPRRELLTARGFGPPSLQKEGRRKNQ